jgi:putative nucleotidyltransferase with HDIG domain
MSEDNSAKPPKLRADPHRVMAWVDSALERRPVQLGLAGLLVLLLALMLGTRLWTRDTLLERVKVGALAEGNIKATRDFDYIPSDEKLEKERAQAVEKVLPVFDYQSDLNTIIIGRISRAFSMAGEPEEPKDPAAKRGAPPEGPQLPVQDPEALRAQFAETLRVEVSPADFAVLKKGSFSVEARSVLQVMVGSVMTQMIVSHRGVLAPFKDKSILVRHLVMGRLGRGGEEKISNLARLKDLAQVREELRLQASVHTAKLKPELAKVIESLAVRLVDSNLGFNRGETDARREAARQSVRLRPISVVKGQVIVRDGDPITKEHLNIIRAMESWSKGGNVVQEIVGLGIFVLIVLVVVFRIARTQFSRFYLLRRDIVVMGVLLVGLVGLTKGVVAVGGGVARGQELPIFLYVIPLASGAMLVRLLISAEASVLFATVLSALCGLLIDRNLTISTFYLVTGMVGASGVAHVQSRSTILRAGLAAGIAGAALLLGVRLFQGQLAQVGSVYAMLGAIAGGVLAAFMTLALLPAVEWLFAYTTDVTLLELANLNHPLLRDLILRAPGTYHHSMVVGNLSEAACEAIGANGLLARVASYYHDIGKVKNAVYFAENFKPGDNPHNRLKPSMSALIIRSHVKDTIEMLREHGVPELVIDTATQHHGKTLIEFFFHKAGEHKEEGEEVHEEDYRYPGPKPQTREAGVIMLADGVEAAARSLAEPSEDRLRAVVQRVINSKFTDGQLDHCDLTLRDLHLIAKSFLQVLRGIYHQRPTYPWQQQQTKEGRRGDESKAREVRDTTKMKAVDPDEIKDAPKEAKKGKQDTPPKKGKKDETQQQAKDGKKTKQNGKDKGKDETRRDARKTGELHAVAPGGGPKHGKKGEPARKAKREDDEAADGVEAEPEGEGEGGADAEQGGTPEAATESSTDLRRLGLS